MLKDTTTEVAINMMNQVVKNIDDNELAVFVKVLQQMKHNIENAIWFVYSGCCNKKSSYSRAFSL